MEYLFRHIMLVNFSSRSELGPIYSIPGLSIDKYPHYLIGSTSNNIHMAAEPPMQNSALWVAVAMDKSIVDIERLLVEAPDTIEQRGGRNRSTPLALSALGGDIDVATLLLKAGANPNSVNMNDLNPIALATQANSLEMIRLLFDYGGKVSADTIKAVVHNNQYEAMRIFLENGVDVDVRNRRGRTPMHIAALYDHRQLFQVLVEWKGDVRATADNGATPLHYAAQKGHVVLVQELIRLGASVSAKTNGLGSSPPPVSNGATPLHYAALGDGENALAYMLDKGGDVDATDHYGWSPMHYAAQRGRNAIIRLLIARGADMQPIIHSGWARLLTPEGLAIRYERVESAAIIRAEIERRKQLSIAFAMGDHKRLGENSRVRSVDDLVLQMILARM
jgi:ankyrin repeat protein